MKTFQAALVSVFILVVILTTFFPGVANAGGVADVVGSVVSAVVDSATTITNLSFAVINAPLGASEILIGDVFGISFLSSDGNCRLNNLTNSPVNVYAGQCGSGGGGAGTGAGGGGGAGVVVIPRDNNVCSFQVPITFYNPYMNFSEGGPTQVGYFDSNDNFIQVADSGRYEDSSCSTPDINGMYGMVNGSCQQLNINVGDCSWGSPDSTINETTRKVAVYRFTSPTSISNSQIDDWFGNQIPASVGNGFELVEQWEGHWPVGQYHNAADSQPIAVAKYSDMCSGNACYFTDKAVPNDSYVAYVAKVFGPYSMSSVHGHSCDTTGWNKYMNTDNTRFATFPQWNMAPISGERGDRITSLGNIIAGPYKTGTAVCGPPSVSLAAGPVVELPADIGLYWNSTVASSCTASGDWSGSKATTRGEERIAKPRGDYTFTLTCSGPGGSASDTKNVKVIDVPYCSFSASPNSIIPPQTSTLSWNCSRANNCSIDQGIGSRDVSGSISVRPANNTTYSLTCSGLDGNRTFQTTISTGFIPTIREIIPRL